MDWRRVHRVGLLVMRPFLGPFRLYVRDIGLYRPGTAEEPTHHPSEAPPARLYTASPNQITSQIK